MKKALAHQMQNQLFEHMLVQRLITQSVDLIHCTRVIDAIKKLTTAYEILKMNREILKHYSKEGEPCWDISSITDLKYIGHELVVYHQIDFDPKDELYSFSNGVHSLYLRVLEQL